MFYLKEYLELEEIEELRRFFVATGIRKEYQKDEFFMYQGQKQNTVGYIQKGGFRYLACTSSGKEHIIGYSFENDFVADYSSLQLQKPAMVSGQAIKRSVVFILSCKELNIFYNNYSSFDIRSKVAEALLSDISTQMLSLYCSSPEERYTKLVERYPYILNLVSLKEIASLIKIAPETLSRIRKKISLAQNP
jgi:CRP-like cAMP-binding protein